MEKPPKSPPPRRFPDVGLVFVAAAAALVSLAALAALLHSC